MALADWSDLLGIITPLILLVWFYYSQIHLLSKNYYSNFIGTYSGFSDALVIMKMPGMTPYAGFIMDIKQVDSYGYFMGEMIYGEVESAQKGISGKVAAIFQFYGKIPYKFYFKKNINPFIIEANSKYFGKIYIVDRFDFERSRKIEDYRSFEYDVTYYREKNSFFFHDQKVFREHPILPTTFTLDKKVNIYNDLSQGVFATVFRPNQLFGKDIRERKV